MKEGLVSVVIPTYNRADMLERCVDSVLKNTYKKVEIIVGDDSEGDESWRMLKRKHGKIIYVKCSNRNISIAVNRALRKASGEFIFLLNDDNEIGRDCIKELAGSFKGKGRDKVGIVGPLALYHSKRDTIMHAGVKRSPFMRRAIYPHQNEKWKGQINEGEVVEDFANAFMFRSKLLKEVGMWDDLVELMGEDGDFEARVRKKGYTAIINPKALTYHNIPFEEGRAYFMRITPKRMYHVLHSKVIYEARYDSAIGKMTFALSLWAYYLFYLRAIIQRGAGNRMKMWRSLTKGMLDGIVHGLSGKNKIERLE